MNQQQLGEEEMMGVNSGPETWADVVSKNRLSRESREEYRDQVSGFEPIEDRPNPIIIDAPLTHMDTNHKVSVLDLEEDVDRSGLVPSWAESFDKLNTIHPYLHDPDITPFSNDETENSEHLNCSLLEVSKKVVEFSMLFAARVNEGISRIVVKIIRISLGIALKLKKTKMVLRHWNVHSCGNFVRQIVELE
ncbi:hypothetical protein V6N13_039708 [Hibiscus sabdariffa]|uniref:Uncharacterized protein n=1 Tax=Hibiscus sabdariffa TaxID=183260 RepID=A0ABR2SUN5_9ROSI